ncbi:Protein ALWAYS EARLY 3, partial [Striga hermonthica]
MPPGIQRVHINGIYYWMAGDGVILSFDMTTEKFPSISTPLIPLPQTDLLNYFSINLILAEFNGQLATIVHSDLESLSLNSFHIQIWVWNHESWSRVLSNVGIVSGVAYRKLLGFFNNVELYVQSWDGEVAANPSVPVCSSWNMTKCNGCEVEAGSDSDQESNDEVRSSRKHQKRARCKVEPPTSKASDSQFLSPTLGLSYGCLSLLKKKRSGGSRPPPVGKRTPRFPISLPYDTMRDDKYFSPTSKGLQLNANADDDEVAHEIAIALAEASQRELFLAEMANRKLLSADMDEEDLEWSTEADTGELFKYKSNAVESEECSGTEEDQKSGLIRGKFDLEANNTNISKSPMQSQRKKSKKVLFGKDEEPAFDALQALADLSLMLPMENEDESRVLLKEEPDDLVDEYVPLESQPANQPREKRKSTGVKMKGHLSSFGAASSKRSKPGKSSALDAFSIPEENQDSIQSNTNKVRRKQKVQVSKNAKPESHGDILVSGSPRTEVGLVGDKLTLSAPNALNVNKLTVPPGEKPQQLSFPSFM